MKQVRFIKEVNGIREYKLNNGLKVLLKSIYSIPLVTFSVWYKVGSRNEVHGIYGLAHFLEHMMFKGTKKYKKGEISSVIQGHGGDFNAFTSSDGTAYYETISPKYLEKALEIESDRMKNSLLDQKELTLERTVVLSELEGGLNNPVVQLDQATRKTAYENSPYKHPTIGYIEDIQGINSEIMKGFYKKYYNPNNSAIVLVGDFEEESALKLINKYFGSIKNESIDINDTIPRDEKQTKEKRFVLKKPGSFKILEIAYHITDAKEKDIYPLNILEEVLIRGKKSLLNKQLIETGLATDISGGAEVNKDPGLFYILVSLSPKASHKKVEKIITNAIDFLIKNPPTESEIEAAKNRIKSSYLFNQDGTYGQVLNIGYFELINNWRQSIDWPNDISKVTTEDVSQVLNTYFSKKNRTVGYFIPEMRKGEKYISEPLSISRTHSYTKPKETIKVINTPEKSNSKLRKPFGYKKQLLKDGSNLIVYKNIDMPVTYIAGIIKGGSSLLSKDKEWSCQLIARTLEKGSKNFTKEEIETILDQTGSHVDFTCDEEALKFGLISLNDNLLETTELLTDLLMNPTFPKREIKKEQSQLIAEIIESKDSTSETAQRRFSQLIYSKDHPFYLNSFDGDIKLIKKINYKELLPIHETLIKKNKAIISIVSNIDDEKFHKLKSIFENKLSTKLAKEDGVANIPDTIASDKPLFESINFKDKVQSDVYLGHAGTLNRKHPDYYKMNIANYILGGSSLASRLSKKVRDDGGLVYTVYSYLNASLGKGEFGLYFGSNNSNVDQSISVIKKQLESFVKDGITEEELSKAKAALIDSFVARFLSTYRNISATLAAVEFYELGDNYINDYSKIINSIKLQDVNKSIKKYVYPDKLNIVVAGGYSNKETKAKKQ